MGTWRLLYDRDVCRMLIFAACTVHCARLAGEVAPIWRIGGRRPRASRIRVAIRGRQLLQQRLRRHWRREDSRGSYRLRSILIIVGQMCPQDPVQREGAARSWSRRAECRGRHVLKQRARVESALHGRSCECGACGSRLDRGSIAARVRGRRAAQEAVSVRSVILTVQKIAYANESAVMKSSKAIPSGDRAVDDCGCCCPATASMRW